ncbi:MAG: hypothetical protein KIT24_11090 [Phycisphaeraceae bacterium]|nr:hypothetical protein [Phycisphaeraceae bacterium]
MLFWIGLLMGLALAALAAWPIVRIALRRARLAERRANASQRLAEVGAMTSGLAHEIRNPLSTIGLNAQLLSEAIDELPLAPEEQGRLTRRIASLRRETERLKGILEDFLRYAGELRLDRHPADLNLLTDELADFFAPQAQAQSVRLRTELAPGELSAELDSKHVKQAILNLVLNAVQAMASHPADRPRELILRTGRGVDETKAPTVELHVIDTGPGIAAENLARLFTPYFTTKSGGTGLGLPTARRIIEAHGGRIDVFSEPGKGTDFRISLPAYVPHPA